MRQIGQSRARIAVAGFATLILLGTIRPAHGAVVVTDSQAFAITIDAAEAVGVDCPALQVRVMVDGTPTTYLTNCAAVTTLTVTAVGFFANTVDLSGVAAQFTSLGTITISGGQGADTILGGPRGETVVWAPGDGNDTIAAGAGIDLLLFNTSGAAESISVLPDGSGFKILRDLATVTLIVTGVESLTVSAMEGVNTITVGDLTSVADLAQVTLASGGSADVFDASAQANPAIALVMNGGAEEDVLIGGAGADTIVCGPGSDLLIGGGGDDNFVWNAGDDSDSIHGEGGVDALLFTGSANGEIVTIAADGTDFTLHRDIGNYLLDVHGIENLDVSLLGGDDHVTTVLLETTAQHLDGGAHAVEDVLGVNALGGCVALGNGLLSAVGFSPIEHAGLEALNVINAVPCDLIFAHGFEAGTTAGWSSVVPS